MLARPYEVVRQVLPVADICLLDRLIDGAIPDTGQNGIGWAHTENHPKIMRLLRTVETVASQRMKRAMQIEVSLSSLREQRPNGYGRIELHQDCEAVGGEKDWDKDWSKRCVVWLPLCDIDDYTPTIEVSPDLPSGMLPHERDAAWYSVMKERTSGIDLHRMTGLRMGDVVILHALAVHRTCVLPQHDKTRRSLDLRMFPMPWTERLARWIEE